jgi:hypothetical protein
MGKVCGGGKDAVRPDRIAVTFSLALSKVVRTEIERQIEREEHRPRRVAAEVRKLAREPFGQ